MKKLILIMCSFVVVVMTIPIQGCSSDDRKEYKTTVTVENIGTDIAKTRGKYPSLTSHHMLLLRSCEDTTLYYETNTSPVIYYNTKLGDTLSFQYTVGCAGGCGGRVSKYSVQNHSSAFSSTVENYNIDMTWFNINK